MARKTATATLDAAVDGAIADTHYQLRAVEAKWLAGEPVDAEYQQTKRNVAEALAWSMRVRGY